MLGKPVVSILLDIEDDWCIGICRYNSVHLATSWSEPEFGRGLIESISAWLSKRQGDPPLSIILLFTL